jgi:hypothetical protein
MPTLGKPRGEAHARIEKCRVRTTFPSCWIRLISAPRLMRCAREKRRRDLRGGVLGRKLHSQALPTLLTTTTQHFAAPARGHPRTKSVLPDSTLVARAIGGLSHGVRM